MVRRGVVGMAAIVVAATSAVGGCGSSKPAAMCGPGLTKAVHKAYFESGTAGARDLRKIGAQLRVEAETMPQPNQNTLIIFADEIDVLAADFAAGTLYKSFDFFIDWDAAAKVCGSPLEEPSGSSSSSSTS